MYVIRTNVSLKPQIKENKMEAILAALISSFGTTVIIIFLAIFFWDKIELFLSRVIRIIAGISKSFHFLYKKSIQLNIQSRINLSVKKLKSLHDGIETEKIKIEWIEKDKKRKAFLDDGVAVIRLRKDDTDEQNYIHGTYYYVSTCLLYKVKNHLTPSQKETMDLFVTGDLVKTEKSSAIGFFMENYLRPCVDSKPEKRKYINNYQLINEHGYFYPVLMNELNYLGSKVFASISKNILVNEFNEIIDFLANSANRKIGDDFSDLEFRGQHTKLLIVIIGKPEKISEQKRYVDYINGMTRRNTINSIYAVGDYKNKEIMDEICKKIETGYSTDKCGQGKAILNKQYGGTKEIKQYYIVLRKHETHLIV